MKEIYTLLKQILTSDIVLLRRNDCIFRKTDWYFQIVYTLYYKIWRRLEEQYNQ